MFRIAHDYTNRNKMLEDVIRVGVIQKEIYWLLQRR
jgi:hypothetical protein